MNRIYLGLGSNMGNRLDYINSAIELISENPKIFNVLTSSFYETKPQGYTDQNDFINCVVSLDTELPPQKLLKFCQKVEQRLKRERLFKWGPRTIDVDILLYGSEVIDTPKLTIPHPLMKERVFVLKPLSEFEPEYLNDLQKLPDQGVRELQV